MEAEKVPGPVVSAIAVGARLKLVGLCFDTELNGRACVVLEQNLEQAEGGRIMVEVEAVHCSFLPDAVFLPPKKVKVRAANLVAFEDPSKMVAD